MQSLDIIFKHRAFISGKEPPREELLGLYCAALRIACCIEFMWGHCLSILTHWSDQMAHQVQNIFVSHRNPFPGYHCPLIFPVYFRQHQLMRMFRFFFSFFSSLLPSINKAWPGLPSRSNLQINANSGLDHSWLYPNISQWLLTKLNWVRPRIWYLMNPPSFCCSSSTIAPFGLFLDLYLLCRH